MPATSKASEAATLYVCASPLGNLGDMSARLAECLGSVAAVFAEDTRRSRVLLDHLGIKKPLHSLHAHNERARTGRVMELLYAGHSVAVISDAGTPVVSDPGADVVQQAHAAGYRVSPLPGPSALTAALSVSGFTLVDEPVWFVGFLATRGQERAEMVARLSKHPGAAVLFESPRRLARTFEELAHATPEREACMCRELTKVHEEVRRGTLQALSEHVGDQTLRGELTIVLGPLTLNEPEAAPEDAAIDAAISRCLDTGLSKRDTAAAVAAILQHNKRDVYARCLMVTQDR